MNHRTRRWLRICAVLLALAGIGLIYLSSDSQPPPPKRRDHDACEMCDRKAIYFLWVGQGAERRLMPLCEDHRFPPPKEALP